MSRDLLNLVMPCLFAGLLSFGVLAIIGAFLRDFLDVDIPAVILAVLGMLALLCMLGMMGSLVASAFYDYNLKHPG